MTRRVAGCLCRNVPERRQYTPRACHVAHPVRAPWRWRRRAQQITRSPGRNVARGRQHALPFRTVALPVLRSRRRRRRSRRWWPAVCIAGRPRRPSAVISEHTLVVLARPVPALGRGWRRSHTVAIARGLVLNGAVRRELASVIRAVALVFLRAGQLTVRKLLDGALSRQYALALCIVAHPVSVWRHAKLFAHRLCHGSGGRAHALPLVTSVTLPQFLGYRRR